MSQIRCPNCNTPIDINKTLYQELESAAKAKLEKEINDHRKKYKEAMEQLKAQQQELLLKHQRLEHEAKLKAQEMLQEQLRKERATIQEEIQKETQTLIQGLKKELAKKSSQLQDFHKAQLEIEKLKREKEEAIHKARLEAEKRLQEELLKHKEQLTKSIAQEHELKLKEKEKQLEDLSKQLEEARRKAELTSQQLQGEVQELAIESWLQDQFPFDTVEEIKKGQRGADCIQTINTREQTNCGRIYYESKRAKEFKREWIEKFKEDMRQKGCDVGVLVTQTLPKGMERMGLVEGVWVCTFDEFKALSHILRHHLVTLSQNMKAQENRSDKMSLLYGYLTSNEFRMQIEAIVEGFTQMQQDLDKEKRAMAKIWKQREKQLDKVLTNTIDMYASIKGIAGNAVGHIQALELPYDDQA